MKRQRSIAPVLGKYLSEILVIIIGITLSFVFDEWRSGRKDRRDESGYLRLLAEDLTSDTAVLGAYISMEKEAIRCTERLANFSSAEEVRDSLFYLLDRCASYVEFAPSNSAYEELRQTGKTTLLRDAALRRGIFILYTQVYGNLAEWTRVDKAQVLSHLIPELNNHMPVPRDSAALAPYAGNIEALQKGKLNHLLHTEIAFKESVLKMLQNAKSIATMFLVKTNAQLTQD